MKKLSAIICLLLVFSLLCSCAKEGESGSYDSAADFTKEDGELYSDVPHERYDGYIFRILNAKTQSSASVLDAETVTGDNLNEAIFVPKHRHRTVCCENFTETQRDCLFDG